VTEVVDGVVTHRTRKDREVLGPKCRRTHDRLVLVDVRLDRRNLVVGVTQYVQCARHRLIDDRHVAAAHELLELHESEIGSMPVVSQSINSPMVPVGASTDA